jgi:hypothetical protein
VIIIVVVIIVVFIVIVTVIVILLGIQEVLWSVCWIQNVFGCHPFITGSEGLSPGHGNTFQLG